MSVKTMMKSHFSNFPIPEHFKKHITSSSGRNQFDDFPRYNGKLEIKRFTIQDMEVCVELYNEVFSADPWYDEWTSTEQIKNYLNELVANPVFEGFVAYDSSDIIAVCLGHKRSWWTGKEFFIDELFVAKNMQGKGIGTQLLDYVESNRLIGDCVRLILLTNNDLPAEKFYLKRGFKRNNKRIIMVKNLI
jgi:ribosomal protein S18 acetylase RimI-like enzyme